MSCCITTTRLFLPLVRSQTLFGAYNVKLLFNAPRSISLINGISGRTCALRQQSNLTVNSFRFKTLQNPVQPRLTRTILCQNPNLTPSFANIGNNFVFHNVCQVRSFNFRIFRVGKPSEWETVKALPLGKRLKYMLKKYWYIAIPIHCISSALWFGALYMICKCGIDGAKVIEFVKPYIVKHNAVPQIVKNWFEQDPHNLGNLAVAVLLYKLATPGRYMTTIFGTFYTLKYLLRAGILIKPANEVVGKDSYLTHAITKNVQNRAKKIKKSFRKLKKSNRSTN